LRLRKISAATINQPEAAEVPPSPSSVGSLCLQSILTHKAQEKVTKYREVPVPFGALILSLGGAMEETAAETLRGWKEELRPNHWFIIRRIAVTLSRARAMVWCF
jgi:hypothetical protein